MKKEFPLSKEALVINPESESDRICDFLGDQLKNTYRRNGFVVGLSGGIDSAVTAALAVRAVGKDKVVGLLLPEKESNPISGRYAAAHAGSMGIEFREINITPTVDSVGGYSWRDGYLTELVPEYTPGCKYNITLPTDLLERDAFNFYTLQVQLPDGTIKKKRLGADGFRTITAFASIKIRARMVHLYWEAERRNLVVAGTTNRTEFILGDICKFGDAGTDIEPISHLYKIQIYQLARYLNVPQEIIERQPSPDTFSLPVSDQEFFFRIPFEKLDLLLYAWEYGCGTEETAEKLSIAEDAVRRAFRDFTSKNTATAHIREVPQSII